MKPLILTALLALSACGAALTGNGPVDCLAARNQVIQLQNAVSGAASALSVAVAADADAKAIKALQVALDTLKSTQSNAEAMALSLCTPVI